MEKPDFASEKVYVKVHKLSFGLISHEKFPISRYNIMLNCWHNDPKSRPLFDNLAKSIEKLLGIKEITEFSIAANDLFLQVNSSELRTDKSKALMMNANMFEAASISEQNSKEPSSIQENCIEMSPITKSSISENTKH